jgi:hypothetical protein
MLEGSASLNRVLKNKNQAVRQGARREPRNAAWRPETQFFNSLLNVALKQQWISRNAQPGQ